MFRGHKIFTLLISLIGAVVLWLYVVTTIKPQVDFRISEIPISIIDRTLEERGLVITAKSAQKLTLDLRTSRANVSKLNAETILVNADASNIKEPGENIPLSCAVTFPDTVRSSDVDILRKSIDSVYITVDRLQRNSFPIQLNWTGNVKKGYSFEDASVVIDPAEVIVTGPEHEVEKIAKVVVDYDVSDLEETVVVTEPIRFLDKDGNEIEFSELTSFNLSQAGVTLPVLRTKTIKLLLEFQDGGGVTKENVSYQLKPEFIVIKGAANVIDNYYGDELVIGKIDLADQIPFYYEKNFDLNLRAGVNNVTGEDKVKAVVRITGVSDDKIDISSIILKNQPDPETYECKVTTSTVKLTVRGSTEDIEKIKANKGGGIYVEVDLSGYGNQTGAFSVQGRVINETYPSVAVERNVEINVIITQRTDPVVEE